MPRKGTKAANAANAKTASLTADGQPTRGGQTTRGAKRRRTSNNVNSASSDIYGTGTIVATNPFDDDHQPPTHHIQLLPPAHMHLQQQQLPPSHQHLSPPMPNSGTQMPVKMMPTPSQMHHLHHPQQNQHHFQQQPHHPQMHPHHQQQHQPYPLSHPPPHHQHQQQQQQHPQAPPPQSLPPNHHPHQQMYSPNHHMQVPPPSHMSATPPGAPPPPMQEHLGPPPPQQQPMSHPQMHPHQQHQGFGPQAHATQMIGTSTPPHMMGPAPSHSPYMNQHSQHGGPMMAPPHQAMTPQPPQVSTPQQQQQPQPHLEQMLMQQPSITTTNQSGGIYCGKCQREVQQHEQNIICKAGCRACFHISCSGLTPLACDLLMKESLAEWACDRCRQRVPPIKYKT